MQRRQDSRREPSLDPSTLQPPPDQAPAHRRRPPPPAAAPRRWSWLLAAALVLATAAGYHWREPLAAWLMPPPPQVRLMQAAEAAFAAGRLSSPDGQGARELFSAVLALDPDQAQAREGLRRVADTALAQGQAALAEDDRERARARLLLAQELGAPPAKVEPLLADLRRRDSVEDEQERLLGQARAAVRAGRLDGEADSALAAYQRMLALQPDNPVALAGRREVLSALLDQAADALSRGELDRAASLIERVGRVDSGHLRLPAARAMLTEALEQALAAAAALREDGDLAQAEDPLRRYLAVRPADAAATAALEEIAGDWARRALQAHAEGDAQAALQALAEARRIAPQSGPVRAAERALAERTGTTSVRDQAEAGRLLAQAEALERAGRLFEPPGGNAWESVQRAAALAPGELTVGRARAVLAGRARDCLAAVAAPADLPHASRCLQVLIEFDPADARLPALRRALAERWLGLAEERLGAGELPSVERALQAAAEADPKHPRLAALRRRLAEAAQVR